MEYLVIGIILLFAFLYWERYATKLRARRLLADIRQTWGKRKIAHRNFDKIKRYNDIANGMIGHEISDQTVYDIDFFELFEFIDRTSSKIGQQYLFNLLKKPTDSLEKLKQTDEQVNFFSKNPSIREQVAAELCLMDSEANYSVSALLSDQMLARPPWYTILKLDVVLLVLSALASLKWPAVMILALLIAAFNVIFVNNLNRRYMLQYNNSLPQLKLLISTARKLIKLPLPFDRSHIEESIELFTRFQRKINILYWGYDQKGFADISQLPIYLFDIVKSIFLIETFTLFSLLQSIAFCKSNILHLFEYVGKVDAAISIASLRADQITTCQPDFTQDQKFIQIKNGIHPLVASCVGNSITVAGKSVLLTGSNMSGKTTFLRTVAINALLAQTIYTCFADAYIAPFFKLYSSIRINDNVFEGKSYFFQEVNVVSELVAHVNVGGQNLYLLDELFKGTNTVERIAAAKAILSYLNQRDHIVFVSTHDVELVNLLENEYDQYHFTETIENDNLYFDYKIKVGPLKTRNAIKILAMKNIPEVVINDAKTLCSTLLANDSSIR